MTKNNPAPTRKIIVIVGPTASGKSDLGIKIAKKFGGEIISADSRQVYRGMDIGTGKVPKDSSRKSQFSIFNFQSNSKSQISKKNYYSGGIKHHLIDVVSPKKQFTADDFKKLGQKAIDDILSRGKVPIIVGGTGFYIDVLLGRMPIAEVPPDKKLRARFDKLTVEHLFKMLQKMDPQRAKTIEPKNKRRLIRALEIVLTTGQPVPKLDTIYNIQNTKYSALWLGLRPKNLEKRIAKRVTERLKRGAVGEVKKLIKNGVSQKRIYDFGLGYRAMVRFLNKKIPQQKMRGEFVKSEIQYSKRQMTWFKRNPEIKWLAPSKVEGVREAEKLLIQFLR